MTTPAGIECQACMHPVRVPADLAGAVFELHSCGGTEQSKIRAWSTDWEVCIVWGTHDPQRAREAWAEHIDPDEEHMPDWDNASQEWADPAELDKDEDEPWTETGEKQLHPHWVPFLAIG